MSNSNKYGAFVSEPIGGKRVTSLPGIGETLGQRLNSMGYDRADQMLGKYLVMKRSRHQFKTWMMDTCGANDRQATDTFESLDHYYRDFM